ncbi:MAG: winged helix-turn-helix transcriptional regulator [Caulobacter sp.]|nr:winged helix-turn-helix transcriptional regulator [Caulobacter sp.]
MRSNENPPGGGFGSRLRKLVDRLDREVVALYRELGVGFEPRWYAVFTTLLSEGPATVGELSQKLGVTHAAVSQVRSALQAEGLIASRVDPRDARRQVLAVTPKGAATAVQLQPLWNAINAATAALLDKEAPGLAGGIEDFTAALDGLSLKERVEARMAARATA